jgi:hypothetical protein
MQREPNFLNLAQIIKKLMLLQLSEEKQGLNKFLRDIKISINLER